MSKPELLEHWQGEVRVSTSSSVLNCDIGSIDKQDRIPFSERKCLPSFSRDINTILITDVISLNEGYPTTDEQFSPSRVDNVV